jgi:CHAD domain-containing protein
MTPAGAWGGPAPPRARGRGGPPPPPAQAPRPPPPPGPRPGAGGRAAPVTDTVGGRPDPADVHRLRKAVRRARYTADVLASFGSGRRSRRAVRTAARTELLQDALGTVHDADRLRATLAAERDPRTAPAVDACDAVEATRADDALAACDRLVRRAL